MVAGQMPAWACLIISALSLAACAGGGSGESRERTLFIDHYKVSCHGVVYQTCLLTRESEQSPYTYFYDGIKDLDFEWGYRYQIRVRVDDIVDPPADGSTLAYSLLEVIEKQAVDPDTLFQFALLPIDGFSRRLSETEFELAYEKRFDCDVSTCDSVDSLLTQDMAVLLEFRHALETSGPLRLQRVLCSDVASQFVETCQ